MTTQGAEGRFVTTHRNMVGYALAAQYPARYALANRRSSPGIGDWTDL